MEEKPTGQQTVQLWQLKGERKLSKLMVVREEGCAELLPSQKITGKSVQNLPSDLERSHLLTGGNGSSPAANCLAFVLNTLKSTPDSERC